MIYNDFYYCCFKTSYISEDTEVYWLPDAKPNQPAEVIRLGLNENGRSTDNVSHQSSLYLTASDSRSRSPSSRQDLADMESQTQESRVKRYKHGQHLISL